MSKSLKRVIRALADLGLSAPTEVKEQTRTAQEAADVLGVSLDQIGKSIILCGEESGQVFLFLTAGGNQVDTDRAAALAGEPLGRADAQLIRETTGFAIGGVSPLGHVRPTPTWMDRRLLDFDVIWCAAGTPRHNFPADPSVLATAIGAQIADFAAPAEKM
ncbi:YbaK/EbsC family protein [Palleronia sp.]|uniref:YbaK/EbsC family protein n=1 Tax=Palleronia sp. TaxID=1940284 RepID=UPI0035C85FD3